MFALSDIIMWRTSDIVIVVGIVIVITTVTATILVIMPIFSLLRASTVRQNT
jgi:hypothetical protein